MSAGEAPGTDAGNEWCELGDKGHGYYYAEPIWAWNPVMMEATFYRGMTSCDGLVKAGFTHWKRAYPPVDGPRVPTQEERDKEVYKAAFEAYQESIREPGDPGQFYRAFLAGIKYAREAQPKP